MALKPPLRGVQRLGDIQGDVPLGRWGLGRRRRPLGFREALVVSLRRHCTLGRHGGGASVTLKPRLRGAQELGDGKGDLPLVGRRGLGRHRRPLSLRDPPQEILKRDDPAVFTDFAPD